MRALYLTGTRIFMTTRNPTAALQRVCGAVASVWEGKIGRYCENGGEAAYNGVVESYKLGDSGYAS